MWKLRLSTLRAAPGLRADCGTRHLSLRRTTLPSLKAMSSKALIQDIENLERLACEKGEDSYRDPATGFTVFTSNFHRRRGRCCGNACRHCPYAHLEVKDPKKRSNLVSAPILIRARGPTPSPNKPLCVVFWSGGKDSFMSLLATKQEYKNEVDVVLLTTFDAASRVVPEQLVTIDDISDQAKRLRVDLVLVPLGEGADYVAACLAGVQVAETSRGNGLAKLVFGDLHIEEIRAWRETAFGATRPVSFPLFGKPYNTLRHLLFESEDSTRILQCVEFSAVSKPEQVGYRKGDAYTQEVAKELEERTSSPQIDAFGENGEFHTFVRLRG